MRFLKAITLICAAALLVDTHAASALTLSEGINKVLTQGYEGRMARAKEQEVEATSQKAFSPLLPQIDAYAGKYWLKDAPAAKALGMIIPQQTDEYTTYGVTVKQVIFDFGKSTSTWKAAKLSSGAQRASTKKTANMAARDFIVTYIGLLEAQRMAAVAKDELARVTAHLNDAQAMFDAGAVTKNDVLQAEVARDMSNIKLIEAGDEVIRKSAAINALLLQPVTEPVKIEDPDVPHPMVPLYEDAVASALASRPELMALKLKVEAKEAELNSKRAEFLPSVFVAGGYGYTENPYSVYPGNWSFYAGATMNLFSGGATVAAMKESKAALEQLRVQYDQAVQAAQLEVQNAFLTLQTARLRLPVAAHAVQQAAEGLRVQRIRYEEGDEISTGVLDAMTSLSKAEQAEADAKFSLNAAEAVYLYAAGMDLGRIYSEGGSK